MSSTVHPHSSGGIGFGVGVSTPIETLLLRLVNTPRVWWRRHVSRLELMEMDDRMLRDIGITRADALFEARKPFWVA